LRKKKFAVFLFSINQEGRQSSLVIIMKGLKYDHDKPKYELIPAMAINELAKVLTFGAEKYEPNSWQNVSNGIERYRAALLRHAFAMQSGEKLDIESGLPHAAHAMCCAAFIIELELELELELEAR